METKKSNHSKDLGETPLSEAAGTFGFTTWKTLKKQNDKESVVDCDVGGVDSGVCTCVAGKISKKPWRIGNPIFMGISPWSGVELHLQEQLAGSTWRSPDLEWSCLLSLFTIRDFIHCHYNVEKLWKVRLLCLKAVAGIISHHAHVYSLGFSISLTIQFITQPCLNQQFQQRSHFTDWFLNMISLEQ